MAGLQGPDFKTAAYVGVIAVVLAAVGTRLAWHRPEVPALAAAVVVTAVLTFVAPADRILALLPGGKTITWSRAVMPMALAIAVLGAFGLDALLRSAHDRVVIRWAAGGFVAAGVVLAGLLVAVQLGVSKAAVHHKGALLWPAAQVVVGLGLVAGLWWWGRPASHGRAPRRRSAPVMVVAVLLAVETGFLLSAGVPFWSVSSGYFTPAPAITALQDSVGSALVGYGTCRPLEYLTSNPGEVGIRPNANIGYGIHEFVIYDPILPRSYYQSWLAVSGVHSPAALTTLGVFCARITTATQARVYGVNYVLEPAHHVGPTGSVYAGAIGRETLYRIPDSASATLVPPLAHGATLPTEAAGVPVAVTYSGPAVVAGGGGQRRTPDLAPPSQRGAGMAGDHRRTSPRTADVGHRGHARSVGAPRSPRRGASVLAVALQRRYRRGPGHGAGLRAGVGCPDNRDPTPWTPAPAGPGARKCPPGSAMSLGDGGAGPGGAVLTVVIVAYGSPALLAEALLALDGTYPVIVVDNASSPETRELSAASGATYIDPGVNLGFAAAVNRALARTNPPSGDVLLLNPDARIAPGEIGRLHDLLHRTPDLAAVAPSLRADVAGRPARATWPWHTPAGAWAEAIGCSARRLASPSYFLGGAVLLLRRQALADVGVLDERFFLYSEDEDWQKRACARGWRVRYCPEVTALHRAGGTEHDPVRLQLRLHAGIERYVRKWYGPAGWFSYRAGTVVGYSARGLFRRGSRRATALRLTRLYLAGPDRTALRAGAVPPLQP